MERENIKAWVTKYALTTGIELVDGTVCHDISSNMLIFGDLRRSAHGADWHRTPEEAKKRAEEMRKTKIAQLRKNIARLEALTFVAG